MIRRPPRSTLTDTLFPTRRSSDLPPAAETAQAEIPDGFSLESDGTTLVHVASGLRFPAEFAGYTRLRERAFDPGGEYIPVGYDRPLGTGSDRIALRIAVEIGRASSRARVC